MINHPNMMLKNRPECELKSQQEPKKLMHLQYIDVDPWPVLRILDNMGIYAGPPRESEALPQEE